MNSFTIYKEYYDLLTLLPRKDRAELSLAMFEYMFEDIKPELNDNQMKVFNNLKRPLDKSKNKSNKASKQNQNEIKSKSKENQIEIKNNSNDNQNEPKTKTHQDVNVIVNDNVNVNVFNYYENNIGSITNVVYEKLNYWCEYFTEDIIKYAIDISCENNVRTMNYIDKILFNWNNAGYKVLADCKNGKNTNAPEWMDKKLEVKKLDEKDKEEIENLLKEFR